VVIVRIDNSVSGHLLARGSTVLNGKRHAEHLLDRALVVAES